MLRKPSLPHKPSFRPLRRPRGSARTALLGGVLIAAVAAPLALAGVNGNTLRGGARNPSSNSSQSYSRETEIIASNSTYGTRQSNKGTGGGAIYGCRSVSTGPACLSAVNLNSGNAFSFSSSGNVGGVILLSNKAGAPLTTNATGVATGFNANYLQGHQASDFAQTGQLLFADVSATGVLGATRGATAAAAVTTTGPGEYTYTVTFNTNVSKCALTASPAGKALTSGSLGLAANATKPEIVEVSAPSGFAQGFNLQVIC